MKAIQNKLNHFKKFAYTSKYKNRRNPLPAIEKVNDVIKKYKLKDENLLTKRYGNEVYESLCGLEFSIWSYNGSTLAHFIAYMFEHFGLIKEFSIDEMKLSYFIQAIRVCYNDNPFHNFKHCFCVTQMIFVLLNISVFKNLSKLEILATLLSAIGHDLDHPGMNNAYQMNALTMLAITYNDSSPLENHHSGPYH